MGAGSPALVPLGRLHPKLAMLHEVARVQAYPLEDQDLLLDDISKTFGKVSLRPRLPIPLTSERDAQHSLQEFGKLDLSISKIRLYAGPLD